MTDPEGDRAPAPPPPSHLENGKSQVAEILVRPRPLENGKPQVEEILTSPPPSKSNWAPRFQLLLEGGLYDPK